MNAGKNGRKTGAIDELDGKADAAMVLLFLGVSYMKHETLGVMEKATSNIGKTVELTRKKLSKASKQEITAISFESTPFTGCVVRARLCALTPAAAWPPAAALVPSAAAPGHSIKRPLDQQMMVPRAMPRRHQSRNWRDLCMIAS